MMLHTKYQGSRPSGFRQEDFFILLNNVTPGAGRNFNKCGKGLQGDATYHISRL